MRSRRDSLTSSDVGSAFRALADEHAEKRANSERWATWQLVQRRLVASEGLGTEQSSRRMLWPAVGFSIAVAAGVAFAVLPQGLRYEVHGADVAAGWIQSKSSAGSVDFSDGSQVAVQPGSSLAIEVVGAHAARTRLAQGDLDVSVKHEDNTDYRFLAGPYQVHVVGTKFHLVWHPEQQLFSVQMREGRVQVTGPNGLDRAVVAGETLRISGAEEQAALARQTENAPPRVPQLPSAQKAAEQPVAELAPLQRNAGATGTALGSAARSNVVASATRVEPTPAWSVLVAKGQFTDVVKAAEAVGTERALRERDAADLGALAHAAHYTGRSALAISAWSSLRERFAGQKSARQAAFFLGRVFDQQGRRAEALRWLNTYLSEAPADVYASEALGRKLSLVNHLEGALAARNVAREYTKRFPHGAYAQTARAILDED
ncbi:MAG TPA: tetratricopeptide repeat protein [Polyangiaceae bacterium]|nr:tetratricopeptide repeat protein [Polyangiaceae bacterium]